MSYLRLQPVTYFFSLDKVKSDPKPANIPNIAVCTGPPNTDTSKTDTVANAAINAAIPAPAAFLKEKFSCANDAPRNTFNAAPANAATTNTIGMSTIVLPQ